MWRSFAPLLATYMCLCGLIQTNYAFRIDVPGLPPVEWQTETIGTSSLKAMQIRSVQVPTLACDQLACAQRLSTSVFVDAKFSTDHQPHGCTFVRIQEASNTSGRQMSLLALSIVKDSRSWGANRGFLDLLNLLTNLTQQTPDMKLSLGLLISDTTTYTDLG